MVAIAVAAAALAERVVAALGYVAAIAGRIAATAAAAVCVANPTASVLQLGLGSFWCLSLIHI